MRRHWYHAAGGPLVPSWDSTRTICRKRRQGRMRQMVPARNTFCRRSVGGVDRRGRISGWPLLPSARRAVLGRLEGPCESHSALTGLPLGSRPGRRARESGVFSRPRYEAWGAGAVTSARVFRVLSRYDARVGCRPAVGRPRWAAAPWAVVYSHPRIWSNLRRSRPSQGVAWAAQLVSLGPRFRPAAWVLPQPAVGGAPGADYWVTLRCGQWPLDGSVGEELLSGRWRSGPGPVGVGGASEVAAAATPGCRRRMSHS